jgi:uncharacterized membrane protein
MKNFQQIFEPSDSVYLSNFVVNSSLYPISQLNLFKILVSIYQTIWRHISIKTMIIKFFTVRASNVIKLNVVHTPTESRGCAVGIATGYGLDDQGVGVAAVRGSKPDLGM